MSKSGPDNPSKSVSLLWTDAAKPPSPKSPSKRSETVEEHPSFKKKLTPRKPQTTNTAELSELSEKSLDSLGIDIETGDSDKEKSEKGKMTLP